MANIKPFRAIRPAKGLESQIAALPYDVYNRAEARAKVAGNPLSFLNIDRPETFFPEGYDMYAPEVYAKASERITQMLQEGSFVQDAQPCYYLYELTMDGRSQTGLVACVSIDDYVNQVVKKHENTREEKEQDRIRHIDACNAQTGPIFLAYRANSTLQAIIDAVKQTPADYAFTADDNIGHRGWIIADADQIAAVSETFGTLSEIYIADGHHRAASAVKLGLKRRTEHPDCTGSEEFNYFLSVLFQEQELAILDYNRVVKDLNGLTEEAFLEAVARVYEVEPLQQPAESHKLSDCVKPTGKGQLAMYLGGRWYRLTTRQTYCNDHPVEGLDVSILQKELLAPILGIADPRTDNRIDFVGGIRGLGELERRVATDCAVAFAMYPTSISELFEVADAGLLMPPKSTWFEPKLRSGLYIHSLA